MRVGIALPTRRDDLENRRRKHAFAHMCAIYGHELVEPEDADVVYDDRSSDRVTLRWPSSVRHDIADGVEVALLDPLGDDLLGQLAFWVGGAGEHLHSRRDAIGRVAFEQSVHRHVGLDPSIPWANRLVDALHASLRSDRRALPERPPPLKKGCDCVVIASHDLDFIPLRRLDTPRRLVRNVGVAILRNRSMRHAASVARAAVRAFRDGRDPLGNALRVAEVERRRGISATWNVLAVRRHPRDGNYQLPDRRVTDLLHRIEELGGEIGVHGSYTSSEHEDDLITEYRTLADEGFTPAGGRQHWLRGHGSRLHASLEDARARFDSTMAWPDRPGFRHGFATPYTPWDEERGRPAAFLELPLVVMDTSLDEEALQGSTWKDVVAEVMTEARRGPGGFSVLWHDTTVADAQLPSGVGPHYWSLPRPGECWITAGSLTASVWHRYRSAGALEA